MSISHANTIDGDGEDIVFEFDSPDAFSSIAFESPFRSSNSLINSPTTMTADIFDLAHIPPFSLLDFTSFSAASTPAEIVDYISRSREDEEWHTNAHAHREEVDESARGKGKAVSRPLDITSKSNDPSCFDVFSFNALPSPSPGPSRPRQLSLSSPISSYDADEFSFSPTSELAPGSVGTDMTSPGSSPSSSTGTSQSRKGKEKARDSPPSLPPLSFSPTGFSDGDGETNWPLHTSPASACHDGQGHSARSAHEAPSSALASSSSSSSNAGNPFPTVYGRVSHARSLTSFPVHNFRRFSLPVAKATRQLKRGKSPSNLARRLFSKGHGNGFASDSSGCVTPLNSPSDVPERVLYASLSAPATPRAFQSTFAFDYACEDGDAEDVQGPPISTFETRLPREIKLRILCDLVDLYVVEGEKIRTSLDWTASRATSSEFRWTGREAGLIELVRMSAVSKSWRDLVFDGQLWAHFDFSKFPHIPESLLLKIASTSGSFVRSLNLSGQTALTTATLTAVMKSLFITTSSSEIFGPTTQLTSINLRGCTALTKQALHDLLMHTPLLTKLDLQGLSIVANETCNVISVFCPSIVSLNLSRCCNIDAYGVIELFKPPRQSRKATMPMKYLRLAGLKYSNDKFMLALGRYAPNLEVLDLSGARSLHNTGLEAFVSCSDDLDQEEVLLTPRQAGREIGNGMKIRRRVTRLRHLSLSHCPLLTDNACSHLAHAVPQLEFLELAGIGAELKDTGLVHLFHTTPLIRRLDLDEACDISDLTLEALTPAHTDPSEPSPGPTPYPGSQLEVLHLSYAVQLTNEALLALIRNCEKLKHLEVDNTRVNGATVKEFVRRARKRVDEGAVMSVVDCRNVGENAVKDLVGSTRTRVGWRGWDARFLRYLDARDNEGLGVGTDECDERRVGLKSFFSWQTVDAVSAAREKLRRTRREKDVGVDYFSGSSRRSSKWWSPGSRVVSGTSSPVAGDRDRDGCVVM